MGDAIARLRRIEHDFMQAVFFPGERAGPGRDPFAAIRAYKQRILPHRAIDAPGALMITRAFLIRERSDRLDAAQVDDDLIVQAAHCGRGIIAIDQAGCRCAGQGHVPVVTADLLAGQDRFGAPCCLVFVKHDLCAGKLFSSAQRIAQRIDAHIARLIDLVEIAIDEVTDIIQAVFLMQVVVFFRKFTCAGFFPDLTVFAHIQLVLAHRAIDAIDRITVARAFLERERADLLDAAQIDLQGDRHAGIPILIDIGIRIAVKQPVHLIKGHALRIIELRAPALA